MVRTSALVLTTTMLVAGCAESPPARPGPHPAASPTTTATPVTAGTVHNDRTSFLVHIRSVRIARHYFVDGHMAEDAWPTTELVIARVVILNTGRAPSHLEATDSQ